MVSHDYHFSLGLIFPLIIALVSVEVFTAGAQGYMHIDNVINDY